jgi:hypothetical protein
MTENQPDRRMHTTSPNTIIHRNQGNLRDAGKESNWLSGFLRVQGVPPIHEHLVPGMELDSGSSNAMEMGPADAEWLIRNAQKLNGESTRSDSLRNYK